MEKYKEVVSFIREQFKTNDFIPLHEPVFLGNEKKYVIETIDSTYVSSVGAFVDKFENMMAEITGASFAVALVNGTNALHMAMIVCDIKRDDEILSQALTFIATANAITYIGATPVFIDVDIDTLSMSPTSLSAFLEKNAEIRNDGFTYNKFTRRRIAACIPMHTFGLPGRIAQIAEVCNKWNITLIEDSAESIGSRTNNKHTGTFGKVGVFSFNGNKTVTCGGGGAIVTDDIVKAKRVKHLSTQAKIPHEWEFNHDEIGYNYRMPNINAALACAQLEQLNAFVNNKRQLALEYQTFFSNRNEKHIQEITGAYSNYWLNAIMLESQQERDTFLRYCNDQKVMSRPIWTLMNHLPMFDKCQRDDLSNSLFIEERLVNIPSGVRKHTLTPQ